MAPSSIDLEFLFFAARQHKGSQSKLCLASAEAASLG